MEANGQLPRILLAMPQYANAVKNQAAIGWLVMASQGQRCRVSQHNYQSSLLGRSFNDSWARALQGAANGLFTHFAMIHSDVGPNVTDANGKPLFWLDEMLAEMQRVKADVISAVVPIKDDRNLTSTAIDDPADCFEPERRLTMTEVLKLPETFSAMDCAFAGINPHHHGLLINTGLLLVDIRGPWIWDDWITQRPIMFTVNDRIVRNPNGQFVVSVESEDWYFSRAANRNRARVFATRKIALKHYGEIGWSNQEKFGSWKVDRDKIKEEPDEEKPPEDGPPVVVADEPPVTEETKREEVQVE